MGINEEEEEEDINVQYIKHMQATLTTYIDISIRPDRSVIIASLTLYST